MIRTVLLFSSCALESSGEFSERDCDLLGFKAEGRGTGAERREAWLPLFFIKAPTKSNAQPGFENRWLPGEQHSDVGTWT